MRKINMLDVSTAHVSKATADWLDQISRKNAAYSWNESTEIGAYHVGVHSYGWTVYCDEEPGEDCPDDLIAVMTFARKQGCDFIWFDRDGEDYDELPRFDW